MSLKHVLLGFLVLCMLAVIWRLAQSDWARGLIAPAGKPPAGINFDNGTVRQYDSPASVAARSRGQPLPLGTLRKCLRGSETTYTDSFCPSGSRELALAKGTVNVLPAAAVPPAPVPVSAGPTLRERAVERAVHQ